MSARAGMIATTASSATAPRQRLALMNMVISFPTVSFPQAGSTPYKYCLPYIVVALW
jgi:hypothetical protein